MSHNSHEDDRFSSMHTSSLFKRTAAGKKKVKIDSRFKEVLTDDRFRVDPGQVDKYGRKKKSGVKQAEKELSEFYEVDNEDESQLQCDNDDEQADEDPSPTISRQNKGKSSTTIVGTVDDMESRLEFLNRFARGEIDDSSSGSNDDISVNSSDNCDQVSDDDNNNDSDSESDGVGNLYQGPLEVPEDGEVEVGESTHRLALQNCDWENLRAEDLQ